MVRRTAIHRNCVIPGRAFGRRVVRTDLDVCRSRHCCDRRCGSHWPSASTTMETVIALWALVKGILASLGHAPGLRSGDPLLQTGEHLRLPRCRWPAMLYGLMTFDSALRHARRKTNGMARNPADCEQSMSWTDVDRPPHPATFCWKPFREDAFLSAVFLFRHPRGHTLPLKYAGLLLSIAMLFACAHSMAAVVAPPSYNATLSNKNILTIKAKNFPLYSLFNLPLTSGTGFQGSIVIGVTLFNSGTKIILTSNSRTFTGVIRSESTPARTLGSARGKFLGTDGNDQHDVYVLQPEATIRYIAAFLQHQRLRAGRFAAVDGPARSPSRR